MLTRTELDEFTPDQKTAVFDKLAAQVFPDTKNMAQTIATELDVTKATFFRWRREHLVPSWAIFLLQEWAGRPRELEARPTGDAKSGIDPQDWAEVIQSLEVIHAEIGAITVHLSKMVDRHAAAQVQTDESGLEPSCESQQSSAE